MAMARHVSESFFDLLNQGSEMSSEAEGSGKNCYPPLECHLVQAVPPPPHYAADGTLPGAGAWGQLAPPNEGGDLVADSTPDGAPGAGAGNDPRHDMGPDQL